MGEKKAKLQSSQEKKTSLTYSHLNEKQECIQEEEVVGRGTITPLWSQYSSALRGGHCLLWEENAVLTWYIGIFGLKILTLAIWLGCL